VQGHGGDTALAELASQTIGTVLGASEDNGSLVGLDDVGREVGAAVSRNTPEVVIHVTRSFVAHHVVNRGVAGELSDQRRDVGS
jgi:predicted GNAT family acetyltransferase